MDLKAPGQQLEAGDAPAAYEARASSRNNRDLFIVVMGPDGSGKTTFISRLTGRDIPVKSNSSQGDPPQPVEKLGFLNQSVDTVLRGMQFSSFEFHGYTVHLLEVPGFGSSRVDNFDLLRDIATWLVSAYQQGLNLSVIIYMYPIVPVRRSTHGDMNLQTLWKMCGD